MKTYFPNEMFLRADAVIGRLKIHGLVWLALGMSANVVWSQTSSQNFGAGTGSQTSQTASTSFLPNPTSGTTYARAGATAPAAPVVLATASNPLGTSGAYVRAVASSSTSVCKFSPMLSYTGGTEFYTSLKVLFGDSAAGTTATTGSWTFWQGAGAMYSDANDFTGAQAFTGLRFTYTASGTVTLTYRINGSFVTTSLTTSTFNQGTVYNIELVANNKTSGTINYTYNGNSRSVAVQKFDLYVNGTLVGDDLASGALPANTSINAATFIGISSTANAANIFVDDVNVYNAVPAVIGPNIVGAATAAAFTTTYGSASAAQNFSVAATNLTANLIATAPAGFEVSTNSATAYASTATFLTNSSGIAAGTLSVRLAATAPVNGAYNATNIVLASTGATSVNITTAASGNSVTAKNLGVTANDTNRVYGAANPVFTASYTGFVNGETTAVLSGSPSLTTVATSSSNAGSYIITAAVGTLSATNYSFTFTNGSLTITKATPMFSLLASANPSGYKDAVTFTANSFAATVTGTVQFMTNGANFGSAVSISGASATSGGTTGLPRGATNVVAANYSGDANYFSATNSLIQTVTNHPPVAVNLAATRATGSTTWKISVSDLLTNVTDVDADTILLTSGSISTNGANLFIAGGFVLYNNTNLVNDQFTYNVSDGFGGTASALVNLAIGVGGPSGQAQSVTISGGTATLQFAGIPGFSYNVQRTTNLVDWTTILTTNPVAGVFQCTDDFSDLGGAIPASAYYRLGWNL